MQFEWDEEKAVENLRKHKISFEDATDIFTDPARIERPDEYPNEERWQTIGKFDNVLFVVHTERSGNIRIISARRATPKERRIYNGNSEIYGWTRINS